MGLPDATPVMRQYRAVKAKHPDEIVFFRLGDFYEMFYEDAHIAARLLGITLTSRQKGIPMAGVPYHSAAGYIRRLLRAGRSVVICEQKKGAGSKRLMAREIVRVITPGTVVEDEYLSGKEANYITAAVVEKDRFGLAWADVSTGTFVATEAPVSSLEDHLHRLSPAELVLPESLAEESPGSWKEQAALRTLPDWRFDLDAARRRLLEHFDVVTLEGFGVEDRPLACRAAGALLDYLAETYRDSLAGLCSLSYHHDEAHLTIDATSARALELVRRTDGETGEGTLLWALDETETPMGARLLRRRLLAPLRDVESIEARLDAVEELVRDEALRRGVRKTLAGTGDLKRLATRAVVGRSNARELNQIAGALERAAMLRAAGEKARSRLLRRHFDSIRVPLEVAREIRRTIVDRPPLSVTDGGIIRPGVQKELDDLRALRDGGKKWLKRYEEEERGRSGLQNLRTGYNRMAGYYIEIPRSRIEQAPDHWRPVQALKNHQRYTTDELKRLEREVLTATDRANEMEYAVFDALRRRVAEEAAVLLETAEQIAAVDCLAALAEAAATRRYVRPTIDDSRAIIVKDGRHPVLERAAEFVPNDVSIDPEEGRQILLVTGPNMAGKSTYIRQVALTVVMAQMGSFVPAKEARIGVVDRVFTRVGAADELYRGRSTFLVEMAETANILNNATDRSLVVLDEIGRGTATFDGLAIAWAVTEHLHDGIGARTLFATHYHELTSIAKELSRVANVSVSVVEHKGRVIFLHRIREGAVDRSYGIHVAELAGVPREVTERATSVLASLEARSQRADGTPLVAPPARRPAQLVLFDADGRLAAELADIDTDNMTPLQALETLKRLKDLADTL